jgi:Uma2 family endonuclease
MTVMRGRTASADPPTGLPFGRPLTVDDLDDLPDDDGHRYELVDGVLIVSPSPVWAHQSAQAAMQRLLHAACPPRLRVVGAPFDWRESRSTLLVPDVLVTRYDALREIEGGKYLLEPPLLAVEVLSPSTRRFDRLTKLSVYEDAGVTSYWLVDPDPEQPVLTVLELGDGRYVEAAQVTGTQAWTATLPFEVTIRPDDLLADLRP